MLARMRCANTSTSAKPIMPPPTANAIANGADASKLEDTAANALANTPEIPTRNSRDRTLASKG